MSASPAFHSSRAARFCERTAWLAAHAATVGLGSALTAAASSRRPSARSSLGQRVALAHELLARQAVEAVDGVVGRLGHRR